MGGMSRHLSLALPQPRANLHCHPLQLGQAAVRHPLQSMTEDPSRSYLAAEHSSYCSTAALRLTSFHPHLPLQQTPDVHSSSSSSLPAHSGLQNQQCCHPPMLLPVEASPPASCFAAAAAAVDAVGPALLKDTVLIESWQTHPTEASRQQLAEVMGPLAGLSLLLFLLGICALAYVGSSFCGSQGFQ